MGIRHAHPGFPALVNTCQMATTCSAWIYIPKTIHMIMNGKNGRKPPLEKSQVFRFSKKHSIV
jgi:hypothetical protein